METKDKELNNSRRIHPDANRKARKALGQTWKEHKDQTHRADKSLGNSKEGEKGVPFFTGKQYDLGGSVAASFDSSVDPILAAMYIRFM